MSIFNRSFRDTKKTLKRIDGAHIKYVSVRDNDGREHVIGRNGAVSVNDERVVLLCEGIAVFTCSVKQVKCSELLSGDGAIFSGIDSNTDEDISVTAHFTSPIISRR